jgi:hypothetical protein
MGHASVKELAVRISGAEFKIKPGSLWYHWKNPEQHYRVIRVGIDEATEELIVVYEMLVEPKPVVWVRPLRGKDGWLTPVKHNGAEISRFQKIS